MVAIGRIEGIANPRLHPGDLFGFQVVDVPAHLAPSGLERLDIVGVARAEPAGVQELVRLHLAHVLEGREGNRLGYVLVRRPHADKRQEPTEGARRVALQVLVADQEEVGRRRSRAQRL